MDGMVYADCDLEMTLNRRLIMDPNDKDARPFALRLTLDRTRHKAMDMVGDSFNNYLSYNELQNKV